MRPILALLTVVAILTIVPRISDAQCTRLPDGTTVCPLKQPAVQIVAPAVKVAVAPLKVVVSVQPVQRLQAYKPARTLWQRTRKRRPTLALRSNVRLRMPTSWTLKRKPH